MLRNINHMDSYFGPHSYWWFFLKAKEFLKQIKLKYGFVDFVIVKIYTSWMTCDLHSCASLHLLLYTIKHMEDIFHVVSYASCCTPHWLFCSSFLRNFHFSSAAISSISTLHSSLHFHLSLVFLSKLSFTFKKNVINQ